MKTTIINIEGINPKEGIKIGDIVNVRESGYSKGIFTDAERGLYLHGKNIELPLDRLKRLSKTASKMCISSISKGYTLEVLQTENHLIVYSHSRGNHWNVFGNHYKYAHDVETGEYIGSDRMIDLSTEKPHYKQRILKADWMEIDKNLKNR